jgi:1,6-anhydro-N-acetylmuramate kinase
MGMKRRTFQMLGGAMMITMAGEALPHIGPAEPCVGTAQEIILCGPNERLLDRRLDHAPESEYDAFGGWIASGQVNSMTTRSSSNPYRFIPAREMSIGRRRSHSISG